MSPLVKPNNASYMNKLDFQLIELHKEMIDLTSDMLLDVSDDVYLLKVRELTDLMKRADEINLTLGRSAVYHRHILYFEKDVLMNK